MKRSAAAALACALAITAPSLALDTQRPLTDYSVTSWAEWNGTPLGAIYSIAQDRDGYLWVGGPSGLLRFDGVRFADVNELGLSALPKAPVMSLIVSKRDGAIWAGFGDGMGVRIIRDGRMDPVTPATALAASATDMCEDASGVIWAATDRGLFRHDRRWEEIALPGNVRGQQVYRVRAGGTGTLKVGTRSGLLERDLNGVFHPIGPQNVTVLGISESRDGHIWVTHPVSGFRPADTLRPTGSGPEGRGFFLFHDSRSQLWVGTLGQGLWRVRETAGGAAAIEVGSVQVSDGIWCVYEDRDGIIWAGTNRGLVRLYRHTMTPVVDYGLVRSVETAATGGIWVGTASGVIRLDGSPATVTGRVAQLRGSDVTSLDVDQTGALWVAAGQTASRVARDTSRGDDRGDQVERGPVVTAPGPIRSIAGDGRGGLWLVDGQGQLLRWSNGLLAAFALPPGVSRVPISFVHLDRRQRLWVVFENGRLGQVSSDGAARLFGAGDGWAGTTTANTITEDRDGALWIGTSGGLTRHKDGAFTTLNGKSRLSGQLVRALIGDDLGYLWLGIGTSMVRLNPAEFDRALVEPGYKVRVREFDAADGVAGVVFGVGNVGAARAADGRLFFVTGRGLTVVDPRTVDEVLRPPESPVRIENVIADDQRFGARHAMSLPAGTEHLRIDYTLPTLRSPSRARFRYRLEGFDRDWIDAGIRRQAFYTNLPAGGYRFVVRAEIPEGEWMSEATALDFRIAPLFYQASWFYALCATALILAAAGAWRLRVQGVQRDLAAVYGERMRLGREIHDTLLQRLAGLALQLDSVEHSVASADARAPGQIARLRDQIEEHIREVRNSIWDLRSPDPRPRSLVDALDDGCRRLVTDSVELSVYVAGTPRRCPERIEDQLLRIAREAVINAVRHGKAASVSLKLAFDRRAVRLTVRDDGCGFDPAASASPADTHYGLSAMKERAAAAGGSCTVTSRPGAGTEVSVVLPLLSRWNLQRLL